MTKYQRETIQREFEGWTPPECFAGGCKKSGIYGFCVHLKHNGQIHRIEEGCANYDKCKGKNFKYLPETTTSK